MLSRLSFATILALVLVVALAVPAGAQSGGCPGGPFEGATPTDSDGDGYSDAEEVEAGTDPCDPTSVISVPVPNPPTLALTGPSTAMLGVVVGLGLVVVGFSMLGMGRRSEI